jgi:ABC-type nitrate/sulfonate/bicarbonate transport system permease component
VVLANARMLGANRRQLLRTVYLPSATSWVFSSLHTSVGWRSSARWSASTWARRAAWAT